MKKVVKFLFVLLMVLSLTGCYKVNMEMEINADKKLTYKAVLAVNKTYIESAMAGLNTEGTEGTDGTGETTKEDDFDLSSFIDEDEYKKAGFTTEEYKYTDSEGNEWLGYIVSKELGNIDDMLLEKDEVVDMSKTDDAQENAGGSSNESETDGGSGSEAEESEAVGSEIPAKLFSKNGDVYKAQFLFDFSDSEGSNEGSMISAEDMAKLFDISYQITLPQEAVSNNATEVTNDGKTLKWTLTYGKKNEVNFEFKIGETNSGNADKKDDKKENKEDNTMLFIGIGGGAALLLVLVIVIVAISSKNKKKKAQAAQAVMGPTNMQQPYDPNMMQQPMGQPMGQPVPQQPMQQTYAPSNMQQPQVPNNNNQPPMQ